MNTINYSNHDLKNIYIKLYLQSLSNKTSQETLRYIDILESNVERSNLNPQFKTKVKNIIIKFSNNKGGTL